MNMLRDLQKERYSYILFKPDSKEKIDEILEEIRNYSFELVKLYYLSPFFEKAIISYENKKNDPSYYQAIRTHLYLCSRYFGDRGLLGILDINDTISLEDFKRYIRKKYTLGEDNASHVIVNLNRFEDFDNIAPEGELCVSDNGIYKPVPFYKKLNGKWIVAALNMLHAPDNHSEYLKDIESYYKSGVLSADNEVDKRELSLIKKYKTYERIR